MLIQLTKRQIRSGFSGDSTSWFWLLLTPLLLLGVYAFVFGTIFRARAPAELEVSFVSWLAIALWPWLAFQDAVLRANESIPQHSALIAKVPMRRELLTLASGIAAFLLQMIGYIAVLLMLAVLGTPISFIGVPSAILSLLTLATLGLGLGLFAAATRVYWRDLQYLLPTTLMLWFFLTPILYGPDLLPERIQAMVYANPLAGLMTDLRAALLEGRAIPGISTLALMPVALLTLFAGLWFFRRLSPFFEDFL